MDLTQIRYFLALARTLNFTRAAEACNVTQPALTRSIQRLEEELGGPLLLRFGIDLAERQGNAAWLLPVPAAFVLDRRGTVAWAHVDADFTRRAEPAEVVAALRALGR